VPADEPLLDAADIQGNILPGFGRAEQFLAGFSGNGGDALRRALRVILPRLTPLAAALDHRDQRKALFLGRIAALPATDLWLNYALGRRATDALGLSRLGDEDIAYLAGMVPARTGDSRRATLGDGSPNPAAPPNWVVGGPNRPLDLLLIFAADRDVAAAAQPVVDALQACGLTPIYRELGRLLPGHQEHFGFQDGISNPGVLGIVEIAGARRHLTTRYGVPDRNGVAYGKPGEPLADPGQFLFGEGALRNGSFLVFRRLRQDVAAFYADSIELAAAIGQSLGTTQSAETVRARIVGRFPSGEPLMRPAANPAHPDSEFAINYFDFAGSLPDLVLATGERVAGAAGDPLVAEGGSCPIWAHIRKVNPRDLATDKGGPDETRGFQMLRRGIPYGPPYDHARPDNPENAADRGLLFLAYQRSISKQFETLNGDWMNSEVNPSRGGFDLLVGQRLAAGGEHAGKPANWFDTASQQTVAIATSRQWVLPTGGAYLFAPSLSWTTGAAAEPDVA
jgi:Dyp-type peroxidase family